MYSRLFVGMAATLAALAVLVVVAVSLPTMSPSAGDGVHRLVIHVDDNDPKRMNMALNNASNIDKYYKDKGEELVVEIVAYGPGLHMLRADTSPVKKRIKIFEENYDNITFKACGNTKAKMSKKAGKDVALLGNKNISVVPAGVVHLMERQEQGWAYVRP